MKDLAAVMWALPHAERNRLHHAIHGNISAVLRQKLTKAILGDRQDYVIDTLSKRDDTRLTNMAKEYNGKELHVAITKWCNEDVKNRIAMSTRMQHKWSKAANSTVVGAAASTRRTVPLRVAEEPVPRLPE